MWTALFKLAVFVVEWIVNNKKIKDPKVAYIRKKYEKARKDLYEGSEADIVILANNINQLITRMRSRKNNP